MVIEMTARAHDEEAIVDDAQRLGGAEENEAELTALGEQEGHLQGNAAPGSEAQTEEVENESP
jgi:hypothetical protein